eukprot:717350-Lingulodinium_polyedra.AAC.1
MACKGPLLASKSAWCVPDPGTVVPSATTAAPPQPGTPPVQEPFAEICRRQPGRQYGTSEPLRPGRLGTC